MKYEFEKVMDGIYTYMDEEIFAGMNDWQDFMARVMVGRILGNQDDVKEMLMHNGFFRTFGIMDSDGMVDVHAIATDIRRELSKKEKITFELPLFGKMTFTPADVDKLYRHITGEELNIYEVN